MRIVVVPSGQYGALRERIEAYAGPGVMPVDFFADLPSRADEVFLVITANNYDGTELQMMGKLCVSKYPGARMQRLMVGEIPEDELWPFLAQLDRVAI